MRYLYILAVYLAAPLISLDLVTPKAKVFGGEVFYVSVELSGLRTAGLDAVLQRVHGLFPKATREYA